MPTRRRGFAMNARCNGLYAGLSREEITSHSAEVLATAWANCPPYQKDRIFSLKIYILSYTIRKPAYAVPLVTAEAVGCTYVLRKLYTYQLYEKRGPNRSS
jgi:hypothetical protein